MTEMFCAEVESPIGPLVVVGDGDEAVCGIYMDTHRGAPDAHGWKRDDDRFAATVAQLQQYFAGERQSFDFDELSLRPSGTPFQLDVWAALRDIPFGDTISYGELARRVGRPGSSRAVGSANGRNPLSIVVPCHRVIGANGTLTGYAGGVDRKAWLLDHERRVLAGLV